MDPFVVVVLRTPVVGTHQRTDGIEREELEATHGRTDGRGVHARRSVHSPLRRSHAPMCVFRGRHKSDIAAGRPPMSR